MPNDLPLEQLGLLHLLERIERGTHVIDSFVRLGLVNQGLILAGEQLELSDDGRRAVAALREAREEIATESVTDGRRADLERRRPGGA